MIHYNRINAVQVKPTLAMCDSNMFFLCDATYTCGTVNLINGIKYLKYKNYQYNAINNSFTAFSNCYLIKVYK